MLFPELIPQKGNEAMLSTVPHEKVEDMAVVFRLDLHSESGMMMSTRVNQAILDGFGMTAANIHEQVNDLSSDLARIEIEEFEAAAERQEAERSER